MNTLTKAKMQILDMLRAAMPDAGDFDLGILEKPPQTDMGDVAFPCFTFAKTLKKAPNAIANGLADTLEPSGLVGKIDTAGPYVNFRFDRKAFATEVIQEVLSATETFGETTSDDKGKVMVEYAQPNTHKDLHVGHLRNICLGLSVVRLMDAAGRDVIPVSYIGDIGADVAKCLWAYSAFHSDDEIPENKAKFLGEMYVEATKKLDEDESLKEEVAETQQQLESGNDVLVALWEETRRWSLERFEEAFIELGATFEKVYYESDVLDDGKKVVEDLLARGIAKESQGAIIVDLEEYDLGVLVILKSDGSALYSTEDLALATKKFADYDVASSVHIVDVRQALYFKQIFKTFELMGFDKELVHLAYEFVTLKDGAMSSRKGNVLSYDHFKDELLRRTEEETKKRHEDWEDIKIRENAWMIAEGAMKFGMLRQDPDKKIVFDIDDALSFEGFTGPYVQYAHARLSSIIAKAGEKMSVTEGSEDEAEYAALRLLAELPDKVRESAAQYKPSILAQYAFELAQACSQFYRDVHVLNAEDEVKSRRLAIAEALRIGLRRSLYLLGISAPEEM